MNKKQKHRQDKNDVKILHLIKQTVGDDCFIKYDDFTRTITVKLSTPNDTTPKPNTIDLSWDRPDRPKDPNRVMTVFDFCE